VLVIDPQAIIYTYQQSSSAKTRLFVGMYTNDEEEETSANETNFIVLGISLT
jgi:hypothetical protein